MMLKQYDTMTITRFTIIGIIGLLSLTGCISTSAIEEAKRPHHWATLVNKNNNLYQISPNLYRSEQPLKQDLQQLHSLNITTVINLRSRNKDAVELAHTPIQLIHIPMNTWAIREQHVADVLWNIRQAQSKGSVLLHCYHGSDRTGLMTAMYRIIEQNWTIEAAQQEMKKGDYGFHPIWINIDALFKPEKITRIKDLIAQKEQQNQHLAQ
jgi:protein-tyrosine phosphatase